MQEASNTSPCLAAIVAHLVDIRNLDTISNFISPSNSDESIDWSQCLHGYHIADTNASGSALSHYCDIGYWEGIRLSENMIIDPYDFNGFLSMGYPVFALDGWSSLLGLTDREERVHDRISSALQATLMLIEVPLSQTNEFTSLGLPDIDALRNSFYRITQSGLVSENDSLTIANAICLGYRSHGNWGKSIEFFKSLDIDLISIRASLGNINAVELLDYHKYFSDPAKRVLPYRGAVPACPADYQVLCFTKCTELAEIGYEHHYFDTPSIDTLVPSIMFRDEYDSSSPLVSREVKFAHRELYAVHLRNPKVTPDGFVIIDDKYILADDISNALPQRKPRRGNGTYLSAINAGSVIAGPNILPQESYKGNSILLSSWIHQVGHFMIDTMPQVYMIDELRHKKLVCQRPSFIYRQIIEYSQDMVYWIYDMMFRAGDRHTISKKFYTSIDSMWVFNTPLDGRQKSVNATAYRYSKTCLDSALTHLRTSKDMPRKIFISRKDARNTANSRTRVINYSEFENLLLDLGFHSCVMSEISVENRVDIFRHAQVVCGIHGSGLFNAVLMPKGSHVVDILPPGGNPFLGLLSILSDLSYHPCPTSLELVDGVDWSRIPIEYLRSMLETL